MFRLTQMQTFNYQQRERKIPPENALPVCGLEGCRIRQAPLLWLQREYVPLALIAIRLLDCSKEEN